MREKKKIIILVIFLIFTLMSCDPPKVSLSTFLTYAFFLNLFFIIGFFALSYFWFEGFPAMGDFPVNELRWLLSLIYSLLFGAFVGFYGSCFANGIMILIKHFNEIKIGARLEIPAFEGVGWWTVIMFVLLYTILWFERDVYILGNRLLGSLIMGTIFGIPAFISTAGFSVHEIEQWKVPLSYSIIVALSLTLLVRVRFYLVGFDLPEPENKGEENEQRQRANAKGNQYIH